MGAARQSWQRLPLGAQAALDQQWAGLAARALPCGSAVTDVDDGVIASGRNRAYDERGGDDALQHTRIAHAELNALARVDTDADWQDLTLWSTQHPCAMCAAAASFTGIGLVVYIADDPSDDSSENAIAATRGAVPYESLGEPVWRAASNLLFLSTGAFLRGAGDVNIRGASSRMPGVAALAVDLAANDHLGRLSSAGYPLPDALEPLWPRLVDLGAEASGG
ncbi:MAG: dCMP deaminase [Microbacteriaceae bacterium]|nr:dCMP deaminase [Microbacteriaceae bacterium]